MIKAILLDLDNTLLRNPDRAFATEYLRLCDAFFYDYWKINNFAEIMISAVRAMASHNQPYTTNTEVLLGVLHEKTQLTEQTIQAGLHDFYIEQHALLQNCTGKITGAEQLVNYLLNTDYSVVIATNPLYPLQAIRQKLIWSGLPDDPDTYTLVTHADNMHFAKPAPAYYAEILARVGVEPDEALMIGDSKQNDIDPANTVGINSYRINIGDDNMLITLLEKIEQTDWLSTIDRKPLDREMIPPQYMGNLGAMFGLLDQVKPGFWLQHPDPDEWSIMQILCHLEDSERDNQRPRLHKILSEQDPFLANPLAPPGPQNKPCDDDGYKVAYRFAEERQKTLDFLNTVKDKQWLRSARHSIFGHTNFLEMAHFTAQHDRLHLRQLCQTIGNCQ